MVEDKLPRTIACATSLVWRRQRKEQYQRTQLWLQ